MKIHYTEIIKNFFKDFFELARLAKLKQMYIVSPWISIDLIKKKFFKKILLYSSRNEIPIFIITREPIDTYHQSAIDYLYDFVNIEIVKNSVVHAKIYLIEFFPFRYSRALLGSPNLTTRGLSQYEIAIQINGIGRGEKIIYEIKDFIYLLRVNKNSKRIKKIKFRKEAIL